MTFLHHIAAGFTQSSLGQIIRPRAFFLDQLKQMDARSPENSLFAAGASNLPFYNLRAVVRESTEGRVSSVFETEDLLDTSVILTDVVGCAASKSSTVFFDDMAVKLPDNDIDAVEYERQVFNGTHDYVSGVGESAQVIRTGWDGQQWFQNGGGSHRAAALWQYDLKHGIERSIASDIEVFDISSELKLFGAENSIWVFKSEDPDQIHNAWDMTNDFGDDHAKTHKFLEGVHFNGIDQDHYALIVARDAPAYDEIATIMKDKAFDLSEWIVSPEAFTFSKSHFLSRKAENIIGAGQNLSAEGQLSL